MAQKVEKSFFELYADEYDLLTNAAQRERGHGKEVAALIERFAPTCVLDAGCATGLTTRLFAERGIETVGLDRSRAMLRVARRKHASSGLPIRFMHGEFERLPVSMNGRFDLVVCLANSITGIPTVHGVYRAFQGFNRVLDRGGHLVLQMLNYAAVAEGELLPIKTTRHGNVMYQRFTERRGRKLWLYVTRVDFDATPPLLEAFRHESDNYDVATVVDLLKRAGFGHIRRFGNLHLSKRFTRQSHDLVVVCDKS